MALDSYRWQRRLRIVHSSLSRFCDVMKQRSCSFWSRALVLAAGDGLCPGRDLHSQLSAQSLPYLQALYEGVQLCGE